MFKVCSASWSGHLAVVKWVAVLGCDKLYNSWLHVTDLTDFPPNRDEGCKMTRCVANFSAYSNCVHTVKGCASDRWS